jgi:hypothetical protein
MRKVRFTPRYNIVLKNGVDNLSLKTRASVSYIQRNAQKDITLGVWAKFDEVNFDGISVLLELSRELNIKSIGSATVNLFSVAQGNLWQKTFIGSRPAVIIGNAAKVDFAANELPQFCGDVTFYVEAIAYRQNKRLASRAYFNHLGALGFMTKNKNKITLLELTKLDE